jgi:hypothetical protein
MRNRNPGFLEVEVGVEGERMEDWGRTFLFPHSVGQSVSQSVETGNGKWEKL